ncbi:Methyltransferase-like protein 16 [Coemansia sp. RSA 2681]|nr:Methyltransferase-like protein 16 [Coemansia sp. RSA 2681]
MSESHESEKRQQQTDRAPSPPSRKRARAELPDEERNCVQPYDLPDNISYRALADKYAELKPYLAATSSQHSTIDFKHPDAVRVLNQALLSVYFGLRIHLPSNSLCPTVSNRLNYVKWLSANIVSEFIPGPLSGLDIGTGASCIYPLLGARYLPQCSFVGTDINEDSVATALANVAQNELQGRIKVFLNNDRQTTLPLDAPGFPQPNVDADGSSFAFCMCNPPFYESSDERERLRQMKLGAPSLNTIAKDDELYTEGGEEAFLARLVDESATMAGRIKWYTTMVGKKSTLALLKARLRGVGAKQAREGVLIQGRTTRWVLAWSFLGQSRLCLDASLTLDDARAWLCASMQELNIHAVSYEPESAGCASGGLWYRCTAGEKTWTRRWRRQAKPAAESTDSAGHRPALRFSASVASAGPSGTASSICLYLEPGYDSNDLMALYSNLRRKLQPP